MLNSKAQDTFTFFSFDFPPNEGGIARMTHEIAIELVNRSHNVKVLTQKAAIENYQDEKNRQI